MIGDKIIKGATLLDTWQASLAYVYQHKVVLGLVTEVEEPLRVQEVPEEIRKQVDELGYTLPPKNFLIKPSTEFSASVRLREWPQARRPPFDQLEDIREALTPYPSTDEALVASRRGIAITMDPIKDCKYNRMNEGYDFPSLICMDYKCEEPMTLHLFTYARHCEMCVWWPLNIVQLAKALNYVLEASDNLKPGIIFMSIGRAFIQEKYLDKTKKILNLTAISTSKK